MAQPTVASPAIDAPGSHTPWASATRASHVPVRIARLQGIQRVAELAQGAPHDFVLTGFGRVAVVHRGGLSVFDEHSGRALFFSEAGGSRSFPSLTSVGVFFGYAELDLQGKQTPRRCVSPLSRSPDRAWAYACGW